MCRCNSLRHFVVPQRIARLHPDMSALFPAACIGPTHPDRYAHFPAPTQQRRQTPSRPRHSISGRDGFMRIRNKAAVAAVAAATAALAAGSTLGPLAGSAGAASKTPVITVTMSKSAITFGGGSTLPAGLIDFKVVSKSGDHALQLLRLHKGYSKQQAQHDVNKSFQGDTKATKRI